MSHHSFLSNPFHRLEIDSTHPFTCRQYTEAADQLAASIMERTACLTSIADVELAGFHVGIGDVLDASFGDVFGWFTPGEGRIPTADLDLQTNTDEVMRVCLPSICSISSSKASAFCRKWQMIYSFWETLPFGCGSLDSSLLLGRSSLSCSKLPSTPWRTCLGSQE